MGMDDKYNKKYNEGNNLEFNGLFNTKDNMDKPLSIHSMVLELDNKGFKSNLKKAKSKDDLQCETLFSMSTSYSSDRIIKQEDHFKFNRKPIEINNNTNKDILPQFPLPPVNEDITNNTDNDLLSSDNGNRNNNNNLLPPEILMIIFNYLRLDPISLNKCSLVCKNWYQVANPLLYYQPRLPSISNIQKFNLLNSSKLVLVNILDLTLLDEVHRNNSQLSTTLAQLIPKLGKQLIVLDLGFCKGLKNYDLQRVLPSLVKLKHINLAGGNRSDIVLTKLVKHCKGLIKLSLSWNAQLTDFGFVEMANLCKNIEYLDLTNCAQISDVSIIAIANHCKNLKMISLSYCQCITDNSLIYLLDKCKLLTNLNVLGCSGVSIHFANSIKFVCPKVIVNLPGLLPFYY